MYALHDHSEYSNPSLGFSDSTNKLEQLIYKALDLGLEGIAITDHEILGGHIKAQKIEKEIQKINPNFKVILGNEIYLLTPEQNEKAINNYISGETKFYHYVLNALDEKGHEQLQILSSRAWERMYTKGIDRRPTLTTDLEEIIGCDKGHVIGQTACLGSYFAVKVLELIEAEKLEIKNIELIQNIKLEIHTFIQWNIEIFGKENFFIEIQPASDTQDEQISYNNKAIQIAKAYNIPFIVTTDSHYLSKEKAKVHSAFLNSKDGEREVDKFYKTAYLMGEQEVRNYLNLHLSKEDVDLAINNTRLIGEKVKPYDFKRKPNIPTIPLPKFKLNNTYSCYYEKYKAINFFANSSNEQDRFLLYQLEDSISKKFPFGYKDIEKVLDRVNTELNELMLITNELGIHLSSYYTTMQKIIELTWEKAESLVGAGRGSAGAYLICYLLDITQINPLEWGDLYPHWRHLSLERGGELPDIDFDTEGLKRDKIIEVMKDYFGRRKVINVCTYAQLSSKTALQLAGKGLGYNNDDIDYLKAMIPIERGEIWSLSDCINGNKKKKRDPITVLKNELNKNYSDLLEIALELEGLIVQKGIHASGVLILNDDYTKYNACMRSSKGKVITQYDLHDSEYASAIKFDFLTINALDKIRKTMDFLIENNKIKWKGSLKETYDFYLHPTSIEYNNENMWNMIKNIYSIFQFDTKVGVDAVNKVNPKSIIDLTVANSLMRLMGDGKETPLEVYVRYKEDINKWFVDMSQYGLNEEEIEVMKNHLFSSYGLADSQEKVMLLSMDKKISNFTLGEANKLRKSIAKKDDKVLEETKLNFFKKGLENNTRQVFLNYVWHEIFAKSFGYSFSSIHCHEYSTIAVQEMNLNFTFPPIYWLAACLCVDSGSLEDEENSLDEFYEEGSDKENDNSQNKKKKTTDYGRLATALSNMIRKGTNVALPDINRAKFGFSPDEENNEIIFGLKGISGIGDDVAYEIINNRPYNSLEDFHKKVVEVKKQITLSTGKKQNKSLVPMGSTISLIKAGAFDRMEKGRSRVNIMKDYLKLNFPDKQTLDLRAVDSVMELGIVPEQYKLAIRVNGFKNYIITDANFIKDDAESKTKKWYKLRGHGEEATQKTIQFFENYFISNMDEGKDYYYDEQGNIIFACKLKSTGFEKTFDILTRDLKQWLKSSDCLNKYNEFKFNEIWNKYAKGNISKWEMDSLSFYYHEHELENVNKDKYYIKNFNQLPEEPQIEKYGQYKDREYPIFKLDRIVGTVLDKDKNKHIITLLTVNGEVVTLKFYGGQFSFYDKTISEQNTDGNKTTIEDSWFKRGNLILVTGYRRGEVFKPKKYKDSAFQHTVALIEEIREDGILILKTDRTKI